MPDSIGGAGGGGIKLQAGSKRGGTKVAGLGEAGTGEGETEGETRGETGGETGGGG